MRWHLFKRSLLGRQHDSLPWSELGKYLSVPRQGQGTPHWFTSQGSFGLLFLKASLQLCDKQLIEQFNTDWSL